MNKSNFERFIAKYHLGGLVGAITIVSDGSKLTVNCASDNKNTIALIETSLVSLDAGSYHIYDTAQLKSLLGVLGDEITVSVRQNKFNIPASLIMTDGTMKVTAILADEKTIPATPKFKTIPPMEMEFKIDANFIARFLKSNSALDATQVAIMSTGTAAEAVIGYSADQNTNRIEVPLTIITPQKTTVRTIYFSTEHMSAILVANKEATSGVLSVASNVKDGLAQFSFDIEGFTTTYFLVGEKQN